MPIPLKGPSLAAALDAQAVFWNWDVEPYSQQCVAVMEALKQRAFKFFLKTGINCYTQRKFVLVLTELHGLYSLWRNWVAN